MKISHIICTRNRAEQLRTTFKTFNVSQMKANQIELILVDSASTDHTVQVMEEFASIYPKTRIVNAGKGLGRARNAGIDVARGDLIAFTDDDCYLDENYYSSLRQLFSGSNEFQYGMGQIVLYDQDDDRRIATAQMSRQGIIKPGTALPAGIFQGANIFFLREVFEKAGKFRDDMGSGTPFPCEDIEFGARCSFAGFTGVLSPLVKVFHHHGRTTGGKEAEETLIGYDFGRGAYYGALIVDGRPEAWKLWHFTTNAQGQAPSPTLLQRIEREFRGAADYIRYRLEQGDTPGVEAPAQNAAQSSGEIPSPKPAQAAKA